MKKRIFFKTLLSLFMTVLLLGTTTLPAFASTLNTDANKGVSTYAVVGNVDDGSWYTPNGGVWRCTSFYGHPTTYYHKMVYLTYDQVALMANENWSKSNIATLKAAAKVVAKISGAKVAAKFLSYFGYACLAYDIFNALSDIVLANLYRTVLSHKHGIKITTMSGLTYGLTTAYDEWNGKYVPEPTYHIGKFVPNK